DPSHAQGFSSTHRRVLSVGQDGQHNKYVLHQQAGRNKIPLPLKGSSVSLELAHTEQRLPQGGAPARGQQRPSGLSQQDGRQLPRVGTKPEHTRRHLPTMGSADPRLVCHQPERQRPVLLQSIHTPGVVGKCSFDEMVRDLCLRFPPN
ncbi:hypothetical protein NDU88_005828, partial [Pleurodeles waltl]